MSVTRKLSRMFHFFRCIPDLMAGQKYVLHDTILLPLIQRFPTATVTVNIIMSGKTWWKHGWIRDNIFCKLEGKPDYILKTSVFPIKNCRSFNLKSPEIDSSQGQLVEKILQYKNPHHLAKSTTQYHTFSTLRTFCHLCNHIAKLFHLWTVWRVLISTFHTRTICSLKDLLFILINEIQPNFFNH